MAAPMDGDTRNELELNCDLFRDEFKRYKRKRPPPDLSCVIDFAVSSNGLETSILKLDVDPSINPMATLKPISEWKMFGLKEVQGFVFISNPFTDDGQKYWIKRCLHDFHNKPNITNLDAHHSLSKDENLWDLRKQNKGSKEKPLIEKLRWATLGYHHDWNTKHYSADNFTEMPEDLSQLCKQIAAAVGWPNYSPEAAIINYYHMDSTLSGHTDHSEFDQEAPLISVSFGQPCIFLVGGTTKETKPHAIYLHSGDIAIMMGPSRLAYHAVPRILHTKEPGGLPQCLQDHPVSIVRNDGENGGQKAENVEANDTSTNEQRSEEVKSSSEELDFSSSKSGLVEQIEKDIEQEIANLKWTEFADYLRTCRINMNVRQVLKPGQKFTDTVSEEDSINQKKIKVS